MTAIQCVCGRVCASRTGFATHAEHCDQAQERSRVFIESAQSGDWNYYQAEYGDWKYTL